MKNLKSTLSTICGIIVVISGAILSLPQYGVEIPVTITAIAGTLSAISVGVIGYLTGKNPDGTPKTNDQVSQILIEKDATDNN